MPDRNRSNTFTVIATILAVILGLYLCSRYNYLLFHGLIEITTIAIAFTLFILTWNTRAYLANTYLTTLGIGYAFIALIDLLHTLAYKGMNVFPHFDANLPTQLWIAARYLQAVTLGIAMVSLVRKLPPRVLLGGYAVTTALLTVLIFSGNFPACFIEGQGLTTFKIASEYLISAFLLAALALFFRQRQDFHDQVFWLTAASIACTALSEISFTAYVSVYGLANLVGHVAKLAAFYLLYRAILVTGLQDPFTLIFRDLKQAEESLRLAYASMEAKVEERTAELRVSENKFRSLIDKVQTAIVLVNGQGHILHCNPMAQELLGLSGAPLLDQTLINPAWQCLREDGSRLPVAEYPVNLVFARQSPLRGYVMGLNRPDRDEPTWVLANAEPEYEQSGAIRQIIVSFVEITQRKKKEEALRRATEEIRDLYNHAPCGYHSLDPDGTFVRINETELSWLGYTSEEILGQKRFTDLITDKSRQTFHNNFPTFKSQGWIKDLEFEVIRKDGTLLPVAVSATAIYDNDGNFIMSRSSLFDITERKRTEEVIRTLNSELEQRVAARTAELAHKNQELERLNKLFVDRELRMIDLKGRIKELENRARMEKADRTAAKSGPQLEPK